jgi:hypothetical protein
MSDQAVSVLTYTISEVYTFLDNPLLLNRGKSDEAEQATYGAERYPKKI